MRPQLQLDGRHITPAIEASFWALVVFNIIDAGGCWNWGGMSEVYGRFKIGKRRYSANRVAYAIAYGFCPADLVVRHTCDNSMCVAPHHLILGTDADNYADRDLRGRTAKGSKVGNAILTEGVIAAIRSDPRTARQIGAAYGVGKSTVTKIRTRVNWRHIA